jgi:hypothetical protein
MRMQTCCLTPLSARGHAQSPPALFAADIAADTAIDTHTDDRESTQNAVAAAEDVVPGQLVDLVAVRVAAAYALHPSHTDECLDPQTGTVVQTLAVLG